MTGTLTAPYCRYDIEQMTVTQLLIAEGAAFAADTPLYEVEVDKTITEVSAAADGKLRKWLIAKGDVVAVGQPVAEIEDDDAAEANGAPPPRETRGPALQEPSSRSAWSSHATLSVEVSWDRVDSALRSAVGRTAQDRPTTTTVLAECLRQTLRDRRKLWRVAASDGRLLNVSSLAVGIAVAREDDELATAVVDDALEHSAADFPRHVHRAIAAARCGESRSLRNVPIVISDLSLYGIRHGVPVVVPPSIGTLFLGEAYSRSNPGSADAGRRCANLALSFDHRCINGVGAASLLAELKRRLETFNIADGCCSEAGRRSAEPAELAAAATTGLADTAEEIVHTTLRELLGVTEVAPDATLWSLGADSMMAAELTTRLNARFGLDLLIHDVYENPTPSKLESLILHGASRRACDGGRIAPRIGRGAVPLSYRQEARWKDFQLLGMACNSRSIARAFRLQGPLEAARLRDAVDELVRRHEALRTRIVTVAGNPMQMVDDPAPGRLEIIDLQGLREERREAEAERLVAELVNEPVDMARGPLFGARLLQLGRDDHVLAFAADHMVADRASAGIMAREIRALYLHDPRDPAVPVPGVSVHLADYAAWQRETREAWLEQHGAYWSERLRGAARLRLPIDEPEAGAAGGGWSDVPIHMDELMRRQLHEFSRKEDSTLALTVLAVYAALVLRWREAREMIVAVMTDGRARKEIQHTVGFFASDLYLRMQLEESDCFRDLHRRVMEEYRTALRHQDFGLLPALMPEARLAAVPSFNWYQTDTTPGMQPFPIRRELRELAAEGDLSIFGGQPWVALTDDLDRIAGCVLYRPSRFREGTIAAALARNLSQLAGALVQNPKKRLTGLTLAF